MSDVLNAVRVGTNNNVDNFIANNPSTINILFTEDGKQIFVNKNGTKIQISDFELVESLPISPFNKIYLLHSNDIYTMNIHDGTEWVSIQGSDIPLASSSVDGKMSSQNYIKLDEISNGATKVESSTTNGSIKIDGVETTVYSSIYTDFVI